MYTTITGSEEIKININNTHIPDIRWHFIKFSYKIKYVETIILTGPKHSGKTSAGEALASLYSCDFIDLDELVFQRTGKSPRQLFSESPAVFQEAEAGAVAAILDANSAVGDNAAERRVIAAGGGIIDNAEAVAALKNSGAKTVYLNISAENAWGRIAVGELPPFLRTENPRETHRALHERRAAAYLRFADIVIEVGGKTPEEIAQEIWKSLLTGESN
jgi:shikimate kinase